MGLSMGILTVSWLILTVGKGALVLSIGRFLAGATAGITCSAVPLYIAEISEVTQMSINS